MHAGLGPIAKATTRRQGKMKKEEEPRPRMPTHLLPGRRVTFPGFTECIAIAFSDWHYLHVSDTRLERQHAPWPIAATQLVKLCQTALYISRHL